MQQRTVGLPEPTFLEEWQVRQHTVSPQQGCIAATFFGFPTWTEELLYQRHYVEDARNADKLTGTLLVLISLTVSYAAVTAWTIPPADAWTVAITLTLIDAASLAASFLPDWPYKPLLRHGTVLLLRLHSAYVRKQADRGFLHAKFRSSTAADFIHNLGTGCGIATLLLYGLGLQMPIVLHIPVHLLQATWYGYLSRRMCSQCSIFMQERFADIATAMNRFSLSFVLLNFQSAQPIDPAAACSMFADICIVVLGVIIPTVILWFNEVCHRTSFRKTQLSKQLRAQGDPIGLGQLSFDAEPLATFPAMAAAALLPVTCLAWQVIVAAETAAFRA